MDRGHRIGELLQRVKCDDAIAFKELYFLAFPSVRNFILSRATHNVPVSDLVQEVFCRLWQQRNMFRGESAGQTYIFGVAMNVLHEYFRGVKKWQIVTFSKSNLLVTIPEESDLERSEIFSLISQGRKTLSKKREAAILLVYDMGNSPRKAAEIAGCSKKTFRLRLDASRHQLEQFLRERAPYLFQ